MLNIIMISILILSTSTISIFSFLQKGPIFSIMYYMSSREERKLLKTKNRYYFIGRIFLIASIILIIVLLQELSIIGSVTKYIIFISILLSIYAIIVYRKLEIERMESKKI